MEKKFAIIDLGSNSVRMIIMKIYEDGSYRMLDETKEMVRLSEGMGKEMVLKPAPIRRTLQVLKLFKKLLEVYRVDAVFSVATAAVRNAKNQKEFLDIVYRETGFEFEVISGEKEGYYAYLGVINTIDIDQCVIVDVGGGSTEVVLVEDRQIKEAISFPFGAVILTEGYLGKKQESNDKIKALEEYVLKQFKGVEWLKKAVGLPIVGLGGTARTLAKINKNEIQFPLTSLHNYQMTHKEMMLAYNIVSKVKFHERKNIPGVNKERADIIIGGIVPIKCLVQYLKAEKLIISGNGLREGVFFEKYLQECTPENQLIEDVLGHSINNILRNYDVNMKHSHHIEKLALSIFDQTTPLHKLGNEERKLLSVAALLHDVGNYVDYYNHQKHGFYLVLNSRLNGLRNRELVMVAFMVSMHREVDFRRDWKPYNMIISKKDFDIIIKLSIFLNIAEKLDRSESRIVEDVDCFIEEESVIVKVKSAITPVLEISTAHKVQKSFKKAFKRELEII